MKRKKTLPRMTLANESTSLDLNALAKALSVCFGPDLLGRKRIDFIFTDNDMIASLAGRFRNSPHPTDVLAFSYENPVSGEPAGEVYVSVDVARRQSRERSISTFTELLLLCIHGVLHVTGQDDETISSWKEMREKEFRKLMAGL